MAPSRALALLLILAPAVVLAQTLTPDQLAQAIVNLEQTAHQTWELGAECQALTEYIAPSYSVLDPNATLPPPPSPAPASLAPVLDIAHAVVANRSTSNNNSLGPQPLVYVPGGAAGDPASIGVAVLLANWSGLGAADGQDYAGAARDQLAYLFDDVPHTTDGAISHRIEQVQLWADSVYMVPPFLAYYGVTTGNVSLLTEAYTQIKLYRSYLFDADASLWRHIVLGSGTDEGHWSTGNAWAAAGMLRVLGTMRRSEYAGALAGQAQDLVGWVGEIHAGMYAHQAADGLFANYADNSSTFADAASTALLAGTVYRLALLAGVHTHLPAAERARKALSAASSGAASSSSSSTAALSAYNDTSAPSFSTSASASASAPSASASVGAGLAHFSGDMWLAPVVNPYDWSAAGTESPESEAFVVGMAAAWRDWEAAGAPGANAAARVRAGVWAWAVLGAAGVWGAAFGWGVL